MNNKIEMLYRRQIYFTIYFIMFFVVVFFLLPINIYNCCPFLISFFVSATLLTSFILMIITNSKSWKDLWNKMNNPKHWILKRFYIQVLIWFIVGIALQLNFNYRKDTELENYGNLSFAIVENEHYHFRKITGRSIDVRLTEGKMVNQILNINIDGMKNINIGDSVIIIYSERYPKINKVLVLNPQKILY